MLLNTLIPTSWEPQLEMEALILEMLYSMLQLLVLVQSMYTFTVELLSCKQVVIAALC